MALSLSSRETTLLQVKKEIAETLRRTLELLDKPASAAAKAVTRNEVVAVSDQVSKQATKVAALWSGDPKIQDGVRVLRVLENTVIAFLGMSNASSVGMGTTLLAAIRSVASGIVESCIALVDGVVAHGLHGGKKSEEAAAAIPPLAGRVWENCEAMKKLPPDNRTAVGRALTHLATSVKDVMREIKDMELAEKEEEDDEDDDDKEEEGRNANEKGNDAQDGGDEEDDEYNLNFDAKLSRKEMEVAKRVDRLCECILAVYKQLLYVTIELKEPTLDPSTSSLPTAPASSPDAPACSAAVAASSTGISSARLPAPSGMPPTASPGLAAGGLQQLPSVGSRSHRRGKHDHGRGRSNGSSSSDSSNRAQNAQSIQWMIVRPPEGFTSINILEKLLKLCKDITSEIEEIGAGLYPPQEIVAIRDRAQKIKAVSEQVPELLQGVLEPFPEKLHESLESLKETIQWLDREIVADDQAVEKSRSK